MIKRITILILFLISSFVLSQKLFYEPFIVPRLAEWQEVPVLWWIGAFAAEFAICVAAALWTRSTREWLSFCLFGALAITTTQWIFGFLNLPGHHKVIEGGIDHFLLQLFIITVLLTGAVGIIRIVRFGYKYMATAS
jgi:hypothetical protein